MSKIYKIENQTKIKRIKFLNKLNIIETNQWLQNTTEKIPLLGVQNLPNALVYKLFQMPNPKEKTR